MHHYIYKISYGNPFYIGVRSSSKEPESDPYMGSGNHCLYRQTTGAKKTILSKHRTRTAAEREESRLLAENADNIWSRNRKRTRCFKHAHV